ncbi:MAG: hypothetical protein ABEH40_07870 [Haloferacaceae archaeon]
MDLSHLFELVPHYALMFAVSFLVLGIVRQAVGSLGFWVEFAIIGVVVFSYRPVVVRLGYAPDRWEQ